MAKDKRLAKDKRQPKGDDVASALVASSASLEDFHDDHENANRGTQRGASMLERSIRELGAGRSIVVDKHGQIIAGNKTRQAALDAGMKTAVVVETDGSQLVVVKRTDLDLGEGGPARQLAYADNRIGEVSLDWDPAQLRRDVEAGVDLQSLFGEKELEQLLAAANATADGFDPSKEWQGMPEFDQADKTAVRRIVVNFKSNADALEFAKLLGQPITDKTRSMWYPAVPIDRLMDKRYEATDQRDDVPPPTDDDR